MTTALILLAVVGLLVVGPSVDAASPDRPDDFSSSDLSLASKARGVILGQDFGGQCRFEALEMINMAYNALIKINSDELRLSTETEIFKMITNTGWFERCPLDELDELYANSDIGFGRGMRQRYWLNNIKVNSHNDKDFVNARKNSDLFELLTKSARHERTTVENFSDDFEQDICLTFEAPNERQNARLIAPAVRFLLFAVDNKLLDESQALALGVKSLAKLLTLRQVCQQLKAEPFVKTDLILYRNAVDKLRAVNQCEEQEFERITEMYWQIAVDEQRPVASEVFVDDKLKDKARQLATQTLTKCFNELQAFISQSLVGSNFESESSGSRKKLKLNSMRQTLLQWTNLISSTMSPLQVGDLLQILEQTFGAIGPQSAFSDVSEEEAEQRSQRMAEVFESSETWSLSAMTLPVLLNPARNFKLANTLIDHDNEMRGYVGKSVDALHSLKAQSVCERLDADANLKTLLRILNNNWPKWTLSELNEPKESIAIQMLLGTMESHTVSLGGVLLLETFCSNIRKKGPKFLGVFKKQDLTLKSRPWR